jgi:hypothetical protein
VRARAVRRRRRPGRCAGLCARRRHRPQLGPRGRGIDERPPAARQDERGAQEQEELQGAHPAPAVSRHVLARQPSGVPGEGAQGPHEARVDPADLFDPRADEPAERQVVAVGLALTQTWQKAPCSRAAHSAHSRGSAHCGAVPEVGVLWWGTAEGATPAPSTPAARIGRLICGAGTRTNKRRHGSGNRRRRAATERPGHRLPRRPRKLVEDHGDRQHRIGSTARPCVPIGSCERPLSVGRDTAVGHRPIETAVRFACADRRRDPDLPRVRSASGRVR